MLTRSLTAILLTLGPLIFTGCASTPREGRSDSMNLVMLREVLTGSFSSAAQAQQEPENYFDIRLHATEIWTDREDGPWLYVEQAAGSALQRPYRQRVYRLSTRTDADTTRYISSVYTMPNALSYAGWWSTPDWFDGALSPEDLSLREGCSIVLRLEDGVFLGSTLGEGCSSELAGAGYATSEVVLTLDRLETWDRGYDDRGEQVWGATEGPYVFDRVVE
ncbi:MAG: chromophore lyase CpcT/CpeT [Planctomycetota bacterium]